MNINPHLYTCQNFGYRANRATTLGVNLTTKKVFIDNDDSVSGEDMYYKYVDECNQLFKSIMVYQDFWLRINDKIHIKENVEKEFYSSNYTIMELLAIMNEILLVRSYKRELCEKYLFEACIKTVEERITSLQTVMCAVECRKFLVEETDFVWDEWS